MTNQAELLAIVCLALLAVVGVIGILVIVLGRGHVRAKAFVARLINLDIEITAEAKKSIEEHLGGAVSRKGDREERAADTRAALVRLQRMLACRILWVDDQPEGNTDENLALQRMGHFVTQATSSEAAEQDLRGGQYDIVITDITRGNDAEAGLAFIRRLRALRLRVPIIVYSDKADSYRAQARKLGANAVARYPSELILAVIEHLRPGWQIAYLLARRSRWRPWLKDAWRRNPRLVAVTLIGALCAVGLLTGTGVAVVRLTQPVCLAMQAGDQLAGGLDSPTCPVRLGPSLLTLDCAQELTIPAARLLTESRDYDGHPTPVDGDGSVVVGQKVCRMSSPRSRVETSLRTTGPALGAGAAVVDFRPITGSSATFGISLGGSAATRGVGVYLFIGSGGGMAAQDAGGRQAQLFPIQGQPQQNAFNRLVLCTQEGRLVAWLNGRQLGQAPSTGVTPGKMRVSLESFEQTSAAQVDVKQLSIFGSGGGCAA